ARNVVGTSGPADIYRWKAQIAKNKKDVIDAETNLSYQKVILNRLLNKPQDSLFITEESGIDDTRLLSHQQRLLKYLEDPQKYKKFVDFIIDKGLNNSTELKALEYVIAVKEREIKAINREFWTPDINFEMNYLGFTQNDVSKTKGNFALGIMASMPIFQGGKRIVRYNKAKEELLQLKAQKELIKEEIESNIRLALLQIGSSYPNIDLSKEAFINTNKALDLVSDAYKQGTNSIIDLLDAQNAALVSEQYASNSIYDFMISLINLQRAIGKVDFSMSTEEWDVWFEELDVYLSRDNKPE
ncbi:MAG: TolC family protein, partial [Vampirovibrionia bacterium]